MKLGIAKLLLGVTFSGLAGQAVSMPNESPSDRFWTQDEAGAKHVATTQPKHIVDSSKCEPAQQPETKTTQRHESPAAERAAE